MTPNAEYGIIGAGSAGLFLANLLGQAGKTVIVFDEQTSPKPHSRSIGIHPPSLELLETLHLSEIFIKEGNPIRSGFVFFDDSTKPYAELSFSSCKKPYTFVLSLPQYQTETILETNLKKYSSVQVFRGEAVTNLSFLKNYWHIDTRSASFRASFLIDASGKKSSIRSFLQTSFNEIAYSDTYLMGDTLRTDEPDHQALIYLTPDGVIESFPLPNGIQRWVFKTRNYTKTIDFSEFASWIKTRTGIAKESNQVIFTNGFGVQKGISSNLASEHHAVIGDAAHVVSPIGGQGMNLAWFNAFDLAQLLLKRTYTTEYKLYFKRVESRWKKVVFRSEFNMFFGRASSNIFYQIKKVGVKQLLKPYFAPTFANQFTMRGIDLPKP